MITTANYRAYELTGQMQVTGIDGQSNITETRCIERIDGAAINWPYEHDQMITEGALVSPGDAYPADAADTIEAYMLCNNVSMSPMQKGKMSAAISWTTRYTWCRNAKTETGASAGSLAVRIPTIQYLAKHRSVQTYRRGWSVAPPATLDISAEIGGSELSSGDKGMPVHVSQSQVRLRMLIDTDGQTLLSANTAAMAYVGRRNSDTFLGFTAQTLVCEGASINHISAEYYELNMEYSFDEWYEHTQVPDLDIDGKPKRAPGGQLLNVYWKRPNRTAVTFNSIWPAGVEGQVIRRVAELGTYY